MHHDAIIIGGSFAGLSAALYIARARRKVCVIDTGLPRNRFAEHSHGFFAQDGSEPAAMLATARAQLAAYPTVSFVEDKAVTALREGDGFAVTVASGETIRGSRLVLAFGISDELPSIPGLAERWGRSVIHCPYCHGYEFSGKRLGVLQMSPMSPHQAMLISEWGPATVYLNGAPLPDAGTMAEFEKRGIAVEPEPVLSLEGSGKDLAAIALESGRLSPLEALYVAPRYHLNSDIADQLGCAMDDAPLGRIVRTDGMKETTVPGVYAAGDIARGAHSVTWAASDGVMSGVALHRSLVF